MMDTNAVSGISTAGQSLQVSAPSPVATVTPPARSDSTGAHDPSLARRERPADARSSEESKRHEPYQSREEKIAEESELRIDRDSETGRIIFQKVRSSTGEVLRQVPSEQMVSLAKSIREVQGLLVDREA